MLADLGLGYLTLGEATTADYVIDSGPGGGEDGGRIIATGTPAEVAANPASVTGRFLRPLIEE